MNRRPGEKLTVYEIAKLAGASKSTVSRVLMNAYGVSPKTRERIQKIMAEYGYRPSRLAQGLAGGRSGLVAVVMPGMFSGYYAEVLKGIDVFTHRRGVRLITSIAHGTDDYYSMIEEYAQPGRVDGVILVAPSMDIFKRLTPPGSVPSVIVSAMPLRNGKGWTRMDSVTVDNAQAMETVVNHLVEHGRRRIVHLAGSAGSFDARERRRTFQQYFRRRRGVAGTIIPAGLTSDQAVRKLTARLKASTRSVDAVVAFNDDMAIGVVKVLRAGGVRVPDDIAVVGCDDEHASEILGLTTLHMPMVELGEEAARLLFERIDRGTEKTPVRRSVLEMVLVVRQTSARPKPTPRHSS